MKALVFPLAVAGAALLVAAPAVAQEVRVTVTPYFWAPGMEGTIAPVAGLPAVETESDFSDIVDDLQLGLASSFEVRRGQWAIVGDLSYVDTGASVELAVPTPQFTSAGLDSKSLMSTLAASYRIGGSDSGSSLDLLAGARINWADNDVRLMRPDGSQEKANDDQIWVDPIIGARVVAQLNPRWSLIGYGDVGGFGVSSDLTWQAMAAVNFRFNERFALTVGYRYYAIDYDHDGFVFDVKQSGPLIGTAITF